MYENIAAEFVDLVLLYFDVWDRVDYLMPNEEIALTNILSAAGFEHRGLKLGTLRGSFRPMATDELGLPHYMNLLCRFMVLDNKEAGHLFATGWLDCCVRHVVSSHRDGSSQEEMVASIVQEIRRSIPLKPIPLNKEGDLLCECPPIPPPPAVDFFVEHTRDNCILPAGDIGTHNPCGGRMRVRPRETTLRDVIVCECRRVHVAIRAGTKTYGGIRSSIELNLGKPPLT